MYVELKMWYFKYILEVDASDLVGRVGGMRMWTYFELYKYSWIHFDSHFAPFQQIFIKFYILADETHISH